MDGLIQGSPHLPDAGHERSMMMTKLTPEITETAIHIISGMGTPDARSAWEFIRKNFQEFDLVAIVDGSVTGDEDAIGCIGRMIRHYDDDVDRRFLKAS